MAKEISAAEAAELLNTDTRTVRRYIERGMIEGRITPEGYRIRPQEIERFTKKEYARAALGGCIEEIYVLRRHNTAHKEVRELIPNKTSGLLLPEKSTIDLAIERYEEERASYFKTLNLTDYSDFLLGKEVNARLKIHDYHVLERMIAEELIEAEKIVVNKKVKYVIYDASFKHYLGGDINNPFFTTKQVSDITGMTTHRIDRLALSNRIGRKILDTKNSHYLFIHEEVEFFKAISAKGFT